MIKVVNIPIGNPKFEELINEPLADGYKLLAASVVQTAPEPGEYRLWWVGTYEKRSAAVPANKPLREPGKPGRPSKLSHLTDDEQRALVVDALSTSQTLGEVANKVGLHTANLARLMKRLGIAAQPALKVIESEGE